MRRASPTSIPRAFVDFQATRPTVSLDEGLTRRIEWPENAFHAARDPRRRPRRRDPARRRAELPLARVQRARRSASRASSASSSSSRSGALLADVPHTRPAPVTGAASDPRSSRSSACRRRATRARPGIVGVLHDACRAAGIPSVSLWSAVPHYVSLAPSPRAARALCDRLGELLGVDDRPDRARGGRGGSTPSRSPRPSPPIPRPQAYVEELERRADTIDEMIDEARPPDRRVARGRADALPARPRERRPARAQ